MIEQQQQRDHATMMSFVMVSLALCLLSVGGWILQSAPNRVVSERAGSHGAEFLKYQSRVQAQHSPVLFASFRTLL